MASRRFVAGKVRRLCFSSIGSWKRLHRRVRATLMNVADRIGEWQKTFAPFCRDKGRTRGRAGALCLSSWPHDSLEFLEQDGRTSTRTSTRPPHPLNPTPCPYRTMGTPASPFLLFSLVKIHQDGSHAHYRFWSVTFIRYKSGILKTLQCKAIALPALLISPAKTT